MNGIVKKLSAVGALAVAGVFMSAETSEAASCARNSSGEITTTSACTVTPDAVYFPIYKFGLCEEVPTYLNYLSACTFLYDNSSGNTVSVTTSSNFQLTNNISITEGTYRAAVVLVGNTIGVSHTEVFAAARKGLEESGGSYADSTGEYCSTRLDSGSEDDFLSNLDCASSELTPGIFSETDGAYNTSGIGGRCTISSGAIDSNLTFTTSSGSTAVCGMLNESTLETYTSGDTNATRQLVVQTFTSPVLITANTRSMDISFKVTDMLSIEPNGTDSSYTQAYLEGFEVAIDVQ